MTFYQPAGGGGGGTINILVQISAQLQQLNQAVQGLQNLQNTTVSVTSGSAAAIGAWGAAFEKVADGVVEAAKKAGEAIKEFITEGIGKAADIQTEMFPLIQLFRDQGEIAKEVLDGMHSSWQQIGVISDEAIGRATRNLALMGVPAENIVSRLQDLAKAAVDTGQDVDLMSAAYQRVRQAIITDTAPAVRGMGAFGASTLAIFNALEDHFHKTEGQIKAMFEGGKISLNDLNEALHESAAEGGRFADAFEQKKETFKGAIQAMTTAFQAFQVQLGTPIIDFLTPIINKITLLEKTLAEVAAKEGWKTAITAAWEAVLIEMKAAVLKHIGAAFIDVGKNAAEYFSIAFLAAIAEKAPKLGGAIAKYLFPDRFTAQDPGEFANETLKKYLDFLANPNAAEVSKARARYQDIIKTIVRVPPTTLEEWVKQVTDDIWADFMAHPPPDVMMPETPEVTDKADTAKQLAAAMTQLEAAMSGVHQQQNLINASPFIGADEKRRREIEALNQDLDRLNKAIANLKQQRDILPLNEAQLQQVNKALQGAGVQVANIRLQLQAQTGPIKAELQKWADSFGNVFQQISKTIESSLNAVFSSFNTWVTTGKFNVQELERSLVLLGLQLLEQLAIQQLMRLINRTEAITSANIMGPAIATALTPSTTAMTISTAGAAADAAPFEVALAEAGVGAVLAHTGGEIFRRFHNGGLAPDEVPLIGQVGEFMVRRSVVSQPGMLGFLTALNQMHDGGDLSDLFNWDVSTAPNVWGRASTVATGGWPYPVNPSGAGFASSRLFDDPALNRYFNPFSMMGPTTPGPFSPGGIFVTPGGNITTIGSSGYPMAIPVFSTPVVGPDYGILSGGHGAPGHRAVKHGGGMIMHGGGGVGRGGGIHIYAFTDLRELTKHMASRAGQKIIFDTVKGRRIDLGIK